MRDGQQGLSSWAQQQHARQRGQLQPVGAWPRWEAGSQGDGGEPGEPGDPGGVVERACQVWRARRVEQAGWGDDLVVIQRSVLERLLRCTQAWERHCAARPESSWQRFLDGARETAMALWPWAVLAAGALLCGATIAAMMTGACLAG